MKWKKVKENTFASHFCIKVSKIHFPLEVKLIKCRSLSEMDESQRKHFCFTHTHIYISIYHLPPSTPTSPTDGILFSTCFLCALKGSWGGGSFCIERLSVNVPFDRYQTKANTELGRKKKRTSHSFPLSWRYIKCCTRKSVYEKVFFFSSILYCERSQVYTFDQFI